MVKNNKLFKVLAIVLIVLAVFSFVGTVQAAVDIDTFTTSLEATSPDENAQTKVTSVANSVLWIVQAVGIAAGVIIIAYMGVKYITSSPDGKADFKKQAYVYVLGAAFLMLAPTIARAVFMAVNQN